MCPQNNHPIAIIVGYTCQPMHSQQIRTADNTGISQRRGLLLCNAMGDRRVRSDPALHSFQLMLDLIPSLINHKDIVNHYHGNGIPKVAGGIGANDYVTGRTFDQHIKQFCCNCL